MSKYQEVMNHIEVDDEMKKRILQNVQNKLEEAPKAEAPVAKVVPFRKYAAIAATFAVLLLGSYAVMQATGGIGNMSGSTSVYEEAASSSEAPAMETEADYAAEAPVMEEAADYAAEAPAMEEEADYAAEAPAMEEAEDTADKTGQKPVMEASAKPAVQEGINHAAPPQDSEEPVVIIAVSAVAAALVLAAIILFVIKKKK